MLLSIFQPRVRKPIMVLLFNYSWTINTVIGFVWAVVWKLKNYGERGGLFFWGSVHQDGESSRSRANVDGTPLGTIFFPPTLHPHWAYVGGVVHSFFSYYSGSPLWLKITQKVSMYNIWKSRDVYRLNLILGTKVENETFLSGFQTLLLVCSLSSRTNPYRHLMPRFVCNLEWSLQSFKTIGKTSYQ